MSSRNKNYSIDYLNGDNRRSVQRPSVVLALGVLFNILALLAVIVGVALLLSIIPFMEFSLQIVKIPFFIYFYFLGGHGIELIFFGGSSLSTLEAHILFSRVLNLFCFFLAGLGFIASVGLLGMKKWGRYLGLILGVFCIFGLLLPIPIIFMFSSIDTLPLQGLVISMGMVLIPPGVVTVVYLISDVKYEFEQMDVETLIRNLSYGERSVRKRAADALGVMGDSRAVEPLIAALRDEDWKVQENAKRSLMKIGEPALEALIQALGSYDPDVRFNAIEILGVIGDERAVDPLIQVLGDMDWEFRENAAWALGEIGDGRALDPLSKLLKDDYKKVRSTARIALKSIPRRDLIRFKMKMIKETKERAKSYKDTGGLGGTIKQYWEEQKIIQVIEDEKRKKILAVKKTRGHIERGILLLGIFFSFLAVLNIIGSILILTEELLQQYNLLSFTIWQNSLLLGSGFEYLGLQIIFVARGFDVLYFMALSSIIIAAIGFPSGISLLKMKKWGYYLALVFGAVSILIIPSYVIFLNSIKAMVNLSLIAVIIYVLSSIFLFIVGLTTISYLSSDVKYEFEETKSN